MAGTEILHMQRLAKGDDAAFELILERYKNRVFGIIYKYIHDRSLAEDLAQEVFTARSVHRFYLPDDHSGE